MLEQIIGILTLILDGIGIALIIAGAIIAVIKIFKIEFGKIKKRFLQYENVKRIFVQKMIFGLDFFIAGDILRTVLTPGLEELARLGVIVVIRTILSFFLGKEIHLHRD